jgi:hypothetical protein
MTMIIAMESFGPRLAVLSAWVAQASCRPGG